MTRAPIAWLTGFSTAHPRAVALGALLLTLISAAFAATHVRIDTDTYALIAPDAPWRMDEARVRAAFPAASDTIVAVVDGATPELADGGAAALAARLGADHAHFRAVVRPDGGPYFERAGLLYAPLADVRAATGRMIAAQPLLGPLAADPSLRGVAGAIGTVADGVVRGDTNLAATAAPMRALADALDARAAGRSAFFSWARLFGGTGALAPPTRRLVVLTPRLDYSALMPGAAAEEAVRAAAVSLALDHAHGVRVRLTGEVPLGDEEFRSLESNGDTVGLVMLGAMLLTLWLALRSSRAVAAVLLTTIAGLVVTTALGLAANGRFNIISIAFIPLFVGLGIDFSIQLATRFRAELALLPCKAGEGNREAVEGVGRARTALAAAARGLGPSLLLAAAAVALGFCAFLPTDYVGIAELGIVAGMGMIVALLLSVTLLPALLLLFAVRVSAREVGWSGAAPLDRFLARHRRPVLWTFAAALALSVAALPLVRFDFNPLHLRDPRSEAVATLADLTRDPDRTPNTIDILAPSLAAANASAARLSRLPEVRAAVTLDSLVPADQPAKLALIADAAALLSATLDPFEVAPPPSDAEQVAALTGAAAKLTAAAEADRAHAADARRLAAAFARLAAASPSARTAADLMLAAPLRRRSRNSPPHSRPSRHPRDAARRARRRLGRAGWPRAHQPVPRG